MCQLCQILFDLFFCWVCLISLVDKPSDKLISLENCLIRLFSMTISYARYDKNMATGKPNKCNRICWNTLFLSADFDAHTQGTTNKVTFVIQRGDVSDVDGITNERVFYNHTILAAVNLDLTTSENTFKTSTNTPEGVMCSFFLSFYANKNKLCNFCNHLSNLCPVY